MRVGKKKQPTYRIVAADSRSPRDGRFIEIVGTYAPREEPSAIKVDNDKAVAWLKKGAQPTDTVRKLLVVSGAWEQFEAGRPPKKASERQRPGRAGSAAKKAPAKKAPAKRVVAKRSTASEAAVAEEVPADEPAGDAEAES